MWSRPGRVTIAAGQRGPRVQAFEMCCKKVLAFHRCLRSVEAERTRGRRYPLVLFAPCFVLADGAGTVLALVPFVSGTLARLLRRTPVLFSRDCCDPWPLSEPAPAGLPAVAGCLLSPGSSALRRAPVLVSRGMAVPLPGADPVVWNGGAPLACPPRGGRHNCGAP